MIVIIILSFVLVALGSHYLGARKARQEEERRNYLRRIQRRV